MPRLTPHQAQQGFMTVVQNITETDYLRLAYAQAMSIKIVMPGSLYAIAADTKTYLQLTDKHHKVFDYIVPIADDYAVSESWKLSNEWQVFDLTPFKETIKVESDILFTRDISHWIHACRLRDIVLSSGCKDFGQLPATSRYYRKLFDNNGLPDVYSGLMYFRYSKPAAIFFDTARKIFQNWDQVKTTLKQCNDDTPTTDVVYAITANIIGPELCTLPGVDFINFTHLKNSINNWPESMPWPDMVVSELDETMIRINNVNQYHPMHYQCKDWLTDEIIEQYEYLFFR